MSHSDGALKFEDGSIMYFEYNGTSNVCISATYKDRDDVSANWRDHKWKECTCGGEELVRVFASYGRGFSFDGLACKNCASLRAKRYESTAVGFCGYAYPYDIEDWVNESRPTSVGEYANISDFLTDAEDVCYDWESTE